MIADLFTKGLPPKMFNEHTTVWVSWHLKIFSFSSCDFRCSYIIDVFNYFSLRILKVIFCKNKVLVYSHSNFSMV